MNKKLAVAAMALALLTVTVGCEKKQEGVSAIKPQESAASILKRQPPQVGQAAADWESANVDGKQVKLSDYHGKKGVLMVFWATWCPYCVEEIPALIQFQKDYSSSPIELIGIAVNQNADVVKRFAERKDINYRLVPDADGKVSRAYGVLFVPSIVGVNAAGEVRFVGNQLPLDRDSLAKELEVGVSAVDKGAAKEP